MQHLNSLMLDLRPGLKPGLRPGRRQGLRPDLVPDQMPDLMLDLMPGRMIIPMDWKTKMKKKMHPLKSRKLLVGVENRKMTIENHSHRHATDTVQIADKGKTVGSHFFDQTVPVVKHFLFLYLNCR